jgi:hypothetical protein
MRRRPASNVSASSDEPAFLARAPHESIQLAKRTIVTSSTPAAYGSARNFR